jgi:predicted 2-oxoglutarate/Fe(II)-dependent dioxygenase YbiX
MALILCSDCKGIVSDKAISCPHCGLGLQKNTESNKETERSRPVYANILDKADIPPAQDERRAHQRINIKMMVKINNETARLNNISKGGMKLATPIPQADPNVEIVLDNGNKVIHVKGTIRWVSNQRSFSNITDIGVEISQAPPEYYEFLDQLLVRDEQNRSLSGKQIRQ